MKGFKHILVFELAKHAKSFFYFLVAWTAIIAVFLAFFEGLQANTEGILKLYETLPKELLQTFGKDPLTITNIYGYFGNAITLYLFLSSCVFVAVISISTLSGEVNNKSILFLQSKPVSRNSIFFGKIFAIIINSFLLNLVLAVVTIILVSILTNETDLNYGYFLMIFSGLFMMQLFFIGLAQVISLRFSSKATTIVSFLVIISYLIHLISGFASQADFLKYFSPNYYINFDEIAATQTLGPSSIIIFVLAILLVWIGSLIFSKKDIEV